jgi:copper chaperone
MSGTYKIEGMTCDGCVRSLTRAIQAVKADAELSIDLEAGTLSIQNLDEAQVSQAVEDAGFDFAGKI